MNNNFDLSYIKNISKYHTYAIPQYTYINFIKDCFSKLKYILNIHKYRIQTIELINKPYKQWIEINKIIYDIIIYNKYIVDSLSNNN